MVILDSMCGDSGPSALRGVSLCKSYANSASNFIPLSCLKETKKPILNSLDINVLKGKIYSLLGPSGSGKTTLLKCLLGLVNIDSGQIQIHPDLQSSDKCKLDLKKLGFMPQEACLYNELQLQETFFYFGKLYSMSNKEIKERQDFLISLLDLPSKRTFVNTYSGGQLRRTSLAIALLNSPRLLVLDEPTVGCDPILRKRIWDFLVDESVNKGTTIIITTHYLDEARRADWVGFIRDGVIIEESRPEHLINKYNKLYLEDVFYTLCSTRSNREIENVTRHDNTEENISVQDRLIEKPRAIDQFNCESVSTESNETVGKRIKNKLAFSGSRMAGHIYKDGLKCMRNKKLLLINLVVPLVQITLFCLCIGQTPSDLQIGYINHEPANLAHPLGQMLIEAFDNKTVIKKRYDTFQEGYKDLEDGQLWLLVEIDQNFTSEIMKYIVEKKQIPYKFNSKVHVYTDNTNHQISLTLREALFRSFQKLVEKYHSNVDLIFFLTNDDQYYYDEKHAYPVIFEMPVYGKLDPIFTHFMAPGIALSVIFFMSVASTASNFVNERRQGLIERSYLTGVKTIEILLSQLFVYSFLMFVQVFIIMVLLFGLLKIPLNGSLTLLIGLMTSQGFCGLCYGLFLASFLYDEETVIQATLASFYPILLMSGIIWPIEAQPYWLKSYVSRFLPLTYASDAFRAILEKNWNLSNVYVLRGFIATYIWTVFFCLFFLIMFTKKFRI